MTRDALDSPKAARQKEHSYREGQCAHSDRGHRCATPTEHLSMQMTRQWGHGDSQHCSTVAAGCSVPYYASAPIGTTSWDSPAGSDVSLREKTGTFVRVPCVTVEVWSSVEPARPWGCVLDPSARGG